MIMSEKPYDGTVAIHIGEIDDTEYLAAEDYLPTLPNTVSLLPALTIYQLLLAPGLLILRIVIDFRVYI